MNLPNEAPRYHVLMKPATLEADGTTTIGDMEVYDRTQFTRTVGVAEEVTLSSALAVRTFSSLGSHLSVYGCTLLGSSMAILDFVMMSSSLSIKSFCRLGSCLSAYGNLRAGGDGGIQGPVALGDQLS